MLLCKPNKILLTTLKFDGREQKFFLTPPTSRSENFEKIEVLDGDSVMALGGGLALAEGASWKRKIKWENVTINMMTFGIPSVYFCVG